MVRLRIVDLDTNSAMDMVLTECGGFKGDLSLGFLTLA